MVRVLVAWQVKLCDPFVTHGPYLSALAVVLPIIRRYTNITTLLLLYRDACGRVVRVYYEIKTVVQGCQNGRKRANWATFGSRWRCRIWLWHLVLFGLLFETLATLWAICNGCLLGSFFVVALQNHTLFKSRTSAKYQNLEVIRCDYLRGISIF